VEELWSETLLWRIEWQREQDLKSRDIAVRRSLLVEDLGPMIPGALVYQNVNDDSLPKRVVLLGIHRMKAHTNGNLEFTASLLTTQEEIEAVNSTMFASSFNNCSGWLRRLAITR
jgi:hypothetical protein